MTETDDIQIKLNEILGKGRVIIDMLTSQQEMLQQISINSVNCREKCDEDFAILKNIGENQNRMLETHDRSLQVLVQTQVQNLSKLVENTATIADHIALYGAENQKMISIIAGKKQVPLSVFIIVLLMLGVGSLLMLSSYTDMQLFVDTSSISIKKQEQLREYAVDQNRKLNRIENQLEKQAGQ